MAIRMRDQDEIVIGGMFGGEVQGGGDHTIEGELKSGRSRAGQFLAGENYMLGLFAPPMVFCQQQACIKVVVQRWDARFKLISNLAPPVADGSFRGVVALRINVFEHPPSTLAAGRNAQNHFHNG